MFTKKNLPAILTVALLILTIGILFCYGNAKIKKAENINSTVLAWENLSTSYPLCKGGQTEHSPVSNSRDENLGGFLCDKKNLNLTIKNITATKTSYEIKWLLNEKVIDSQKIEVSAQGKKIIPPTKKVADKLATLLNQNQNNQILFQTKTTWNKNKKGETLGKWIEK
jgi:hypothetical protein